jgi:hypothetical protein
MGNLKIGFGWDGLVGDGSRSGSVGRWLVGGGRRAGGTIAIDAECKMPCLSFRSQRKFSDPLVPRFAKFVSDFQSIRSFCFSPPQTDSYKGSHRTLMAFLHFALKGFLDLPAMPRGRQTIQRQEGGKE